MELLLATNHLGLGGSESYLLTVAEQLDRLGHRVRIYAPEGGDGAAVAAERRLDVVDEASLPERCDAALVQDGGVAHQLADRYPAVPQVFVAHSEMFDLQAPPQLPGVVGVVVVLNDRVADRMRSYAVEAEVVRLAQPIDTERFLPLAPLPEVPRRALLLSNTPHIDRLAMLETACAEVGVELTRIGGTEGQVTDPRPALADAEIVIGYGRSILEAMACGRAAYVYDWTGGDGWVSAESFAAIESGGFAGRSGARTLELEDLVADLAAYRSSMGPVNRDLVMGRHRANVHAQRLVELCRRLGPGTAPAAPLQEMARLVRLEWRARAEVHALIREITRVRELAARTDQRIREAEAATAAARAEVGENEARVRREYEQSTSWRLTAWMRTLGAKARSVRAALGRASRD